MLPRIEDLVQIFLSQRIITSLAGQIKKFTKILEIPPASRYNIVMIGLFERKDINEKEGVHTY